MTSRARKSLVHGELPAQPSKLIGREEALALACEALLRPECRLLTLMGVGGVGKTRLAVAVAETLVDRFEDGICFVDLSQIIDPAAVPLVVATELDLRVGSQSPVGRIRDFLRDRRVLLVLDNFEHVLPAAMVASELLEVCPDLKILATSREPLRLRWEQRFVVGPLEVPDLRSLTENEDLESVPSVALFLQRAHAVNMRFDPDYEALRQIAAVCMRLDGIPLALELAAARTNLLSPSALLSRLEDQSSLLRQHASDAPVRHQSLEATLEWSYRLLPAHEQACFRRLGVFVGGFTIEAVQAVTQGDDGEADILDTLSDLIEKDLVSLVPSPDSRGRYRLLETVRSYAKDQLRASDELERFEAVHARYYLALAESQSRGLRYSGFLVFSPTGEAATPTAADLLPWPAPLSADYANIRAAFTWAQEHDSSILLRLAAALPRFWWVRGSLTEAAHWLERARHSFADGDPEVHSRVLGGLGVIYRQQGKFEQARLALEEAVVLSRSLGSPILHMAQLIDLAAVIGSQNRIPEAITLMDEALERARALEDAWGIAAALTCRGLAKLYARNGEEAEADLSEAVPLFRQIGDLRSVVAVGATMARVIWLEGDVDRALPLVEDSLRLCREVHQDTLSAMAVEMAVCVLSREGVPEACARLLGAADEMRVHGFVRIPLERDNYEETLAILSTALSSERIALAMTEGRQLLGDKVLDEALALVEQISSTRTAASGKVERHREASLSKRELDVLSLLMEGCSNREISVRLNVSENTVKFHVTSILTKLGASSRHHAVSIATRRGLA